MGSLQRRRGQRATIYRLVPTPDRRGNEVLTPTADSPHVVSVAQSADNARRIAGQYAATDLHFLTDWGLLEPGSGVGIGSPVQFDGQWWEIREATRHDGNAQTRNSRLVIRSLPGSPFVESP